MNHIIKNLFLLFIFFNSYAISININANSVISNKVKNQNSENTIQGYVFKSDSRIPLSGANVILKSKDGSDYGSSSDKDGFFFIKTISPGDYEIFITFIGYEDYSETVNIEMNNTYNLEVFLSIEPIVMTKLNIISDSKSSYENLPGAATIIDSRRMKIISPIGTQEILEKIPGISGFADDGIGNSRISIGIRGLNPRRSSRTLILEDGIPIQPALYIYPNMYYNPPSERISRVEVIKGSGAIAFGPQTMGGIINYFTKRPRNSFGGLFRLTSGENGYLSLFSEVGGWGTEKLNPELQILYKRGDGFRDNNDFEQINSTFKLTNKISDKRNIYIKANLNYENSNATYTGLTQWSFENNPNFNPKNNDNFKLIRTSFDFIETVNINSKLTKTSSAFVSYFDRRWWRENDIFIKASDYGSESPRPQPYYSSADLMRVGGGVDNFGILRTFYVIGYDQNYKYEHSIFGNKANLDMGARIYWDRFIDDKQTGMNVDSRDGIYYIEPENDTDSPEIVGQSHHYHTMALSTYFSEKIDFEFATISPGLRLEVFEQERVDRLSGSLYQDKNLVVFLPGIGFSKSILGMNLFAGIHRGFTPPSSGALKILNFGDNISSGSLDLDSEKSWNKEIGLRGDLNLINFELSGFHLDIENLVAAGRGTAFKNLGKVQTYGIEFNSRFKFSDFNKFIPNIFATYTYLQTEVLDGEIVSYVSGSYGSTISIEGNELPYSPKSTLIIGLEISPINNLDIMFDYKYVSSVFTDFENIIEPDNLGISGSIPSYGIYNISFNYNFGSSYRMFMTGKNLTDEIYIGSRLHSNPGQKSANLSSGILPGARRQINFGIEYLF